MIDLSERIWYATYGQRFPEPLRLIAQAFPHRLKILYGLYGGLIGDGIRISMFECSIPSMPPVLPVKPMGGSFDSHWQTILWLAFVLAFFMPEIYNSLQTGYNHWRILGSRLIGG